MHNVGSASLSKIVGGHYTPQIWGKKNGVKLHLGSFNVHLGLAWVLSYVEASTPQV